MVASSADGVSVFQSTVEDGPFPLSSHLDDPLRLREQFLRSHGLTLEQSVLVRVDYTTEDYIDYRVVSEAEGGNGLAYQSTFSSDALFTQARNIALFLHLADCIGAVVSDSHNGVLGLSHLGRHNLLQNGGAHTVEFMQATFGTKPEDIQVFLSAAAGKSNYPLYDFDNQSLHEVSVRQLMAAGVKPENITIDPRDTTIDSNLFSHSQFLHGKQANDGRHAIVAVRR